METLVKIPVDNNLKGAFKNSNKYASDGYKDTTNPFASTNSWFSTNVTSKVSGLFSSLFGTGSGSVGSSANAGMSNLKSPFNSGSTGAVATFKTITSGIIGKFKETFENTGAGTIAEKAVKGFDNLKKGFEGVGTWFKSNVVDVANRELDNINTKKTIGINLAMPEWGRVWNTISGYKGEIGVTVNIPDVRTSWGTVSGGKATGYAGTKLIIKEISSGRIFLILPFGAYIL